MDYSALRTPQLQHLASGGDVAAATEISRRATEAPPPVDVRSLAYPALRNLVLAWSDAATPDERARSRVVGELAQIELEIRYIVDRRRWDWQGPAREPQPPPAPPWLHPRPQRCISWKRPRGSRLYPSDEALERARFNAAALNYYREAAGAPSKERT